MRVTPRAYFSGPSAIFLGPKLAHVLALSPNTCSTLSRDYCLGTILVHAILMFLLYFPRFLPACLLFSFSVAVRRNEVTRTKSFRHSPENELECAPQRSDSAQSEYEGYYWSFVFKFQKKIPIKSFDLSISRFWFIDNVNFSLNLTFNGLIICWVLK